MARRLFNLAVVLSALLSVAAAGWWVRSLVTAFEFWAFEPVPTDGPYLGEGRWHTFRRIEAYDGQVSWVEYDDWTTRPVERPTPHPSPLQGNIPGVAQWLFRHPVRGGTTYTVQMRYVRV